MAYGPPATGHGVPGHYAPLSELAWATGLGDLPRREDACLAGAGSLWTGARSITVCGSTPCARAMT